MKRKFILSLTIFSILFFVVPFFSVGKTLVYAQLAPVQIYQAQPKNYSWQVVSPYGTGVRTQDRGVTFTNNQNPFEFEIYGCPPIQGNASKEVRDYCIPRASSQSVGKYWSNDTLPAPYVDTCRAQQKGFDGPMKSADTRQLNGTSNTNANAAVCAGSTAGARATLPFLNITKQFTYNSSLCAGTNRVSLASRIDPGSPECANLNYDDAGKNPGNYTKSQLRCLMYVDNTLDLTACKNGNCRTINFTGQNGGVNGDAYVLAQRYQNVCSIFNQGDGVYDVTLKAYDVGGILSLGGVSYGSSSFWLTWLDYVPYTISGTIVNDANQNGVKDGTEANYAATPSITASRGTVTVNANGTYTVSNVYPGSPVTISYNSLPFGYKMTSPLNGPPPSFQVSVGSSCNTNGSPGATCVNGNITNLNFGVTNSFPWIRTTCGDFRMDEGITNPVPAGQYSMNTTSSCTSPGIGFTGNGTPSFGSGQASTTNQVVGGVAYPEVYATSSVGGIASSYTNLTQKALTAGITPIDITTLSGCINLANCTLPANLPHGLYQAKSNVVLNGYTFPAGQNYVFLINGTLTIRGNVLTPVGSTAFFSAADNIIIPSSVGSSATSAAPNLSGVFSTDKSFIVQSNNNCNDLRLNLEGTLILNAARGGSQLQNDRDLCGGNAANPTLQLSQRLDFVLNLPTFLRTQNITSQEVTP